MTTPSKRKPRAPWFGRLATWYRDDEGRRCVTYRGRTHHLVYVTRRDADALGGGTRPGWHLDRHPDLADDELPYRPVGPRLARTLAVARRHAEAWIILDPGDRCHHGDVPNLLTIVEYGRGTYTSPAGCLVAQADPDQGRVLIRHGREPHTCAGTITLQVQDDTGGLAFIPATATGATLPAAPTWREAVRALSAALAAGEEAR